MHVFYHFCYFQTWVRLINNYIQSRYWSYVKMKQFLILTHKTHVILRHNKRLKTNFHKNTVLIKTIIARKSHSNICHWQSIFFFLSCHVRNFLFWKVQQRQVKSFIIIFTLNSHFFSRCISSRLKIIFYSLSAAFLGIKNVHLFLFWCFM